MKGQMDTHAQTDMQHKQTEYKQTASTTQKRGECSSVRLTDFCLVPGRQELEVWHQSTSLQHLLISVRVHGQTHQDIILQATVLDPGVLCCVGCASMHLQTIHTHTLSSWPASQQLLIESMTLKTTSDPFVMTENVLTQVAQICVLLTLLSFYL